ncbi:MULTISPECIES: helix-turn-helix domain-containing protein [Argonema]|uniref:helix-turn-helix domain-containing protein n=1 Tax=Argonema TaxID=2942761 RepID=UPI0020112FCA|nr:MULTISPECIES: helix-turn-helix transcriptional regulator [Argonema]MCL1466257.1 helix-turn-helix domain-containing protein [Argonema galeatum A003/A1]MCL1473751.1 helix-turn-helix domain-containing protein [Argonema antarcticum A004/B2]
MNQTSFGKVIRDARNQKGYSQKELAKEINVHFTYLSKLENDRPDNPLNEEYIRSLAHHLDLDAEELTYLAGRIPKRDEDFFKQNHKQMPALFRRLQEDPNFAQKVFQEAAQPEDEENQS